MTHRQPAIVAALGVIGAITLTSCSALGPKNDYSEPASFMKATDMVQKSSGQQEFSRIVIDGSGGSDWTFSAKMSDGKEYGLDVKDKEPKDNAYSTGPNNASLEGGPFVPTAQDADVASAAAKTLESCDSTRVVEVSGALVAGPATLVYAECGSTATGLWIGGQQIPATADFSKPDDVSVFLGAAQKVTKDLASISIAPDSGGSQQVDVKFVSPGSSSGFADLDVETGSTKAGTTGISDVTYRGEPAGAAAGERPKYKFQWDEVDVKAITTAMTDSKTRNGGQPTKIKVMVEPENAMLVIACLKADGKTYLFYDPKTGAALN